VSLLQIGDALKIDEKNPNALSMLGSLELQCDETWLTAKEHFRIAKEATKGDAYSFLQLVCEPRYILALYEIVFTYCSSGLVNINCGSNEVPC
jgi:hypothetical protein